MKVINTNEDRTVSVIEISNGRSNLGSLTSCQKEDASVIEISNGQSNTSLMRTSFNLFKASVIEIGSVHFNVGDDILLRQGYLFQ